MTSRKIYTDPHDFRLAVRKDAFHGVTAGQCPGYVQVNVVIIPSKYADKFRTFCNLNPKPCPIVAEMGPGQFKLPPNIAGDGDIRTDVPGYKIFRKGILDPIVYTNISQFWDTSLCTFLLGCSFTFERALTDAGLTMKHHLENTNVPMYNTNIECHPVHPFVGYNVVSMRPFTAGEQVNRAISISSTYPTMHGAPLHVGTPESIGITDISHPDYDYGDRKLSLKEGEVPVFWACGVTPQKVIQNAKISLAITHSPGKMLVTDLKDEKFHFQSLDHMKVS